MLKKLLSLLVFCSLILYSTSSYAVLKGTSSGGGTNFVTVGCGVSSVYPTPNFVAACSNTAYADATTINAAIAALPAVGGKVFLQRGNYYIQTVITAVSNMTIECEDPSATTIHLKSATAINMLQIDGVNNVKVIHCGFDGNLAGNPQSVGSIDDSIGNDIEIHGANHIEISGNYLNNAFAHGAFERDVVGSTDVNFHDNLGNGNGCRFIHVHGNATVQNSGTRVINNTGSNGAQGVFCASVGDSGTFVDFANDHNTTVIGNIDHDEPGPCFSVTGMNAGAGDTIPSTDATVIGNIGYNCGQANGAIVNTIVQAGGGVASHSYVPASTLTATGMTCTVTPTWSITTTKLASINSIAVAGATCTNGAQTFTGTTGTGTKFIFTGTVTGNALTSTGAITTVGSYTVNPTSLASEPVSGGGCGTPPQVSINMGVNAVSNTAAGTCSAPMTNPVSTTSNDAGTGAALALSMSGYPGMTVSGGMQFTAFSGNDIHDVTGHCYDINTVSTSEVMKNLTFTGDHGRNCGGDFVHLNGGSQTYQNITFTNMDADKWNFRLFEIPALSGGGVMDNIHVIGGNFSNGWGPQGFYVNGGATHDTNMTIEHATLYNIYGPAMWFQNCDYCGANYNREVDDDVNLNTAVNSLQTCTHCSFNGNFGTDVNKSVSVAWVLADSNTTFSTFNDNQISTHGTGLSLQGANLIAEHNTSNNGNINLTSTATNGILRDNQFSGSGTANIQNTSGTANNALYLVSSGATFAATNAGSTTVADGITDEAFTNGALIAAFTVTTPAHVWDGERLCLGSVGGITALTITANTNQSVSGVPTTLAATVSACILYQKGTATWYPD